MKRLVKIMAMVTIATFVGVAVVYATATYSPDGFVSGSGGGIVIGGVQGSSTACNRLSFQDTVNGGAISFDTGTRDIIQFYGGDDAIYFEAGNDGLHFQDGDDVISMGYGADQILMSFDNDLISFQAGDDGLQMDDGDDYISMGTGNDKITFGRGDGYVTFDHGPSYGVNYSLSYTDISGGTLDYATAIGIHAPSVVLGSVNLRDPSVSTDDYVGASIDIDRQDSNGNHTGDVVITLGAGEN